MANALKLVRGNTLVLNYTGVDSAGNAISLTGATLYFTVKQKPGWDTDAVDGSALWQITSTGNISNKATFTSLPAQTWVTPGTYDWDITIKYADGTVVTPLQGTIQIIGTPTNKAS